MSLEDEFWIAFDKIAKATVASKNNVLAKLSNEQSNLSFAVRLSVLRYYVDRAKMIETIAGTATR